MWGLLHSSIRPQSEAEPRVIWVNWTSRGSPGTTLSDPDIRGKTDARQGSWDGPVRRSYPRDWPPKGMLRTCHARRKRGFRARRRKVVEN
jgi:hypothetical protein